MGPRLTPVAGKSRMMSGEHREARLYPNPDLPASPPREPRARWLPRREILPLAADPPPRQPSASREVGAAHGRRVPPSRAAAAACEAWAPQGEVRGGRPHGRGRGGERGGAGSGAGTAFADMRAWHAYPLRPPDPGRP